MVIALYCFILLVLGYVSFCFPIGFIIFRKLTQRSEYEKKSVVDSASHVKDNKIMPPLLAAKERWPTKSLEKVSVQMPANGGLSFLFEGSTHKNLCADLWMHENFPTNKTIAILVHGFTDSAAGLSYLAESYYERAVSVLAVNLRGHGDSGGAFSGLGSFQTDGKDIRSWVLYLRNRFGKDINIVLHGVSMGGSSVIQGAFYYSLPVKLVVSDCTFSDYSANVHNLVQSFFPRNIFSHVIIKGICACTSFLNYIINGFYFSQNSPKLILKNTKNHSDSPPLVIFHGMEDSLVNQSHAKDLFGAAKNQKEIFLIESAPHIGSWFYNKEKYMKEVFKYLQV